MVVNINVKLDVIVVILNSTLHDRGCCGELLPIIISNNRYPVVSIVLVNTINSLFVYINGRENLINTAAIGGHIR